MMQQSTSKFLIYGLFDPRTEACRYIGRSSSGLHRPRQHTNRARRESSHKSRWICQLLDMGLAPVVRVLQECSSPEELSPAEVLWITKARSLGWPLTNLTDGGEGLLNPSAETRRKIGARSKERMANPYYVDRAIGSRRGKRLPQEWRDNMSASFRGRKYPPEFGRAISARQTGKKRGPLTAEHRAKLSAAGKGKKKSDDHKKKIGASLKGKKKRPGLMDNMRMLSLLARRKNGAPLRKDSVFVTFSGVTLSLPDWCHKLGLNYHLTHRRLRAGWDAERAFFEASEGGKRVCGRAR